MKPGFLYLDNRTYVSYNASIMKQVALIGMLAVVSFAVALVAFIASQLSMAEVALLAGMMCGIGLAVPLGVTAGAAIAARRRRERISPALPVIYVAQPPASTVAGSQLPQVRLPQPGLSVSADRPLNIIGQTGFDSEH
jgi:hypothetical protein